tara:strand:+ start:469 stop:648 length:180 start_codon:yes stop_codon:yes gene_type:complete
MLIYIVLDLFRQKRSLNVINIQQMGKRAVDMDFVRKMLKVIGSAVAVEDGQHRTVQLAK